MAAAHNQTPGVHAVQHIEPVDRPNYLINNQPMVGSMCNRRTLLAARVKRTAVIALIVGVLYHVGFKQDVVPTTHLFDDRRLVSS